MVWRQLPKLIPAGSRERSDAQPRGPLKGVSADTRLSCNETEKYTIDARVA